MKGIVVLICHFIVLQGLAQETTGIKLNLETGKAITSFLYQSGTSVSSEGIQCVSSQAYGASLDISLGEKSTLQPALQYYEGGAQSNVGNLPVSWQLNYLGVGANYLYTVFSKGNYTLRPGVALGTYYMLRGTQLIGTQNFNTKETGAFKPWDVQTGLVLSNLFKVSDLADFFVNYRFDIGLNQIEKEDVGEKTRNMAHKIMIGLRFTL
jgi:hypothetical protein